MPKTPAELVAAVPAPLRRFVLVSAFAGSRRGNLPRGKGWAELRRADLRTLLTQTPPIPQCEIAEIADISAARVSRLAREALGESRA